MSGASEFKETRRTIQLLVREGTNGLRGRMAVTAQEVDGFGLAGGGMFERVFGIHPGDDGPGDAGDRIPGSDLLGQVDFDRVNAGHMVNDQPDPTPVRRNHGMPAGIRQPLCKFRKCVGALFDALRQQ